MKVLFIVSGNKNGEPGVVVKNQAESIVSSRLTSVDFFLIVGKGLWGYFRSVPKLSKVIRKKGVDILHAHGFASLTATLSLKKPIVVSLLGSEVLENKKIRWLFRLLAKRWWNTTVVKSLELKQIVGQSNQKVLVIPNGVDTNKFKPNMEPDKEVVGFSITKKTILFLADPTRESKNFNLSQNAFSLLNNPNVELKVKCNFPKEDVPKLINAADIILITSKWEGSPNVVKEAMACNKPIVATNVGDIAWLFDNEPGHFLTDHTPYDVAHKLKLALEFIESGKFTKGRTRIFDLGLDSETIANKIYSIYEALLNEKQGRGNSN